MLRLLTALVLVLTWTGPMHAQARHENYHRAAWLPDGETILFMSDRDGGDWELYTMRLDGTELRRLTRHEGWDGYAAVSPDGRSIVFDRGDDEGGRLVLMDLTTRNTRVLVRSHGESLGGGKWAPDGQHVYFRWERDGKQDVYVMPSAGGEPTRVTDTPQDEIAFAVSPNGDAVAVVLPDDSGHTLEVMDLRSHRRRQLLKSTGSIYGVEWSPDGRAIAYNTDEDGDHEIFVIAVDGGRPHRITRNEVTDHQPTWSPDGSRLAYTRELDTGEVLMIMNADGSDARRVVRR